MSQQDDQDWFDLIAGRDVPGASPQVRREARVLRATVLARQREEETAAGGSEAAAVDIARLQEAVVRHLRAGSGAAQGNMRESAVARWLPGLRRVLQSPAFGVGFALLLAAVTVRLMLPMTDERLAQGIDRGGLPELVVRQVDDPGAEASRLAAALRDAGLKPDERQLGQFWYVEATLPDKPGPKLVNVLKRFGIDPGLRGRLRVVISHAGPAAP